MNQVVVSYGGGINSTAMLVGMVERGFRPDAILFADTGGERESTYAFVQAVSDWCVSHGLPPVTTVRTVFPILERRGVAYSTLEDECLQNGQLPSLAYGFHKCADKWKVRAQMQWLRTSDLGVAARAAGEIVYKCIGFHADEQRRIKSFTDPGTEKMYPLVEWGWTQADCLAAIRRTGLPQPAKSACFFCPATPKRDVATLAVEDPALFARAVAMEHAAQAAGNLKTVVGLGRHWTWESVGKAATQGCNLPAGPESSTTPCGCWDGSDNPDEDD